MSWTAGPQTYGHTQSFGGGQSYGGGGYDVPTGPVTVQISRRNPSESWGFRLQGGTDFRQQLCVKKVAPGGPADGRLTAGDGIISISGYDAKGLTHAQASQMIKTAGMSLDMTINKGAHRTSSTIKPSGPMKFSPGTAHQFGYK